MTGWLILAGLIALSLVVSYVAGKAMEDPTEEDNEWLDWRQDNPW